MMIISSWSKQSLFFPWNFLFGNHICSLKMHKFVFDQEELLKSTWKSLQEGFLACWLQWWWLEVCLTNSLWDKVCISLNNGYFAKKKKKHLFLGFSPYPLLPLSFCHPQMKFYPNPPQNFLDLPIRKKYIWWRKMEHFAAIFFRCNLLSNVAKYS